MVHDAVDMDRKENLSKRPMERANKHLENLLAAIKSCGISFNVWEKLDAAGGSSGRQDFTSLMGSDKKVLLSELPSKLDNVLQPSTKETVVNLWKV